MSSYYGTGTQAVPSWDVLNSGDDDEVVDDSEVSCELSIQLTSVRLCLPRSRLVLYRCLVVNAAPSA